MVLRPAPDSGALLSITATAAARRLLPRPAPQALQRHSMQVSLVTAAEAAQAREAAEQGGALGGGQLLQRWRSRQREAAAAAAAGTGTARDATALAARTAAPGAALAGAFDQSALYRAAGPLAAAAHDPTAAGAATGAGPAAAVGASAGGGGGGGAGGGGVDLPEGIMPPKQLQVGKFHGWFEDCAGVKHARRSHCCTSPALSSMPAITRGGELLYWLQSGCRNTFTNPIRVPCHRRW